MDVYNFLEAMPNINPSQITTYLNIAFYVIIGIILLGGIVGLIRGVWSSGFRLIFIGILVILSYILAGTIGTAVADVDLSKFNIPSFTIGEQIVTVTTIKETLIQSIAAFGTSEGGDVQAILSDEKTLALVTELALMIVRLITFIILAIVVIIVGNLLATILYHVLFKHFVNKNLRKKVKLRLVGFAFGLVKTSMVLSMLVVPFSGLLNSISTAMKKASNDDEIKLDSKLYNEISTWINAYDNSILAQGLFGWTELDGKTLDMRLLDVITSDKNSSLKLSEEVSNLTTIAATLVGTNAVEANKDESGTVNIGINAAVFLDSKVTSTLLATIATSSLCTQLLPIAATFAFNMDEINVYFNAKDYDLSKINWQNDLESINKIFTNMSEAGLIDADVIENPSILIDRIYNTDNESVKDQLVEAFKTFDNVTAIQQLLPSFLYTLVSKGDDLSKSLSDYLPTNSEDYDGISWGSELANLYDSTYRINKVTDNAIVDYIKTPNDDTSKARNIRKEGDSSSQNEKSQKLIDAIIDNIGDIIPIFVGERSSEGELINVDDKGFTLEKDTNGNVLQSCLLDSELLSRSISKILNTISKMAINALSDSLKIENEDEKQDLENKLITAVNSIDNLKAVKKELGALFDIVNDVVSDDALLPLIKGGDKKMEFNEETCEALKTPVSKISKSKILDATILTIIKYTVNQSSSELNDGLKSFGLTVDSLNFEHVDDIGAELSLMLDAVPAIQKMSKTISGESIDFNAIDQNDLKTILNTVYASNIFNPQSKEGEVRNFFKIIDKVFTDLGYNEGRITEGLEDDKYWSGTNSEINQFCNIFGLLKEDNFFKLKDSKDAYLDSNILKPESVEELFGEVDKSKLLSKGLGTILDSMLLDSLKDVVGDKVSFKNINNWASEGENFANVIDSLQKFNKQNISLDKIDFLNSTITDVDSEGNEILLTQKMVLALSNSSLFENGSKGFGDFLFDKLKGISSIKMNDINKTGTTELTYVKSQEIFNSIDTWEEEVNTLFTFIKELQKIGKDIDTGTDQLGTSGMNELIANPSKHADLFKIINKSEAFRMPIANAIYDAANSVNVSSLPALNIKDNINIDALVEMDSFDDRDKEIGTICNILSDIDTLDGKNFDEIKGSEENRDTLKNIMENIHNSKMFNKPIEEGHVTVFENLIETILSVAGISDEIICGKLSDTMTLTYNTTIDIIQGITNNYADDTKEDKWVGGEIDNLMKIIDDTTTIDLTNIDLTTIDLENTTLLEDLNNSKLLYRSIPYFINEFAAKADTSGFSMTFDLNALKADYAYNEFSADYEKYDESEINILKTIFSKYSIMNSIDVSTIKNRKDDVSELLKALYNSQVFNSESSISEKDTVFIQVIEELFNKSKLDEAIYDDTLFDYGGKSIAENAQTKIKEISSDDWEKEIDNIIGIVDALPSKIKSFDDISVSNISPEEITTILKAINKSDLCYDAVPKYVKQAFTAINIAQFSNNHEDYLTKSASNYRELYWNDEANNGEIKVLEDMLNTLYDETNKKYMQFDDGFKVTDFVKLKEEGGKGKSLTSIISFLTNSKVFKGCRGEVFYNAIDSVGFSKNIREKDTSKWQVFDDLFTKIENIGQTQVTREGSCLDTIVEKLETIISASSSGTNTLKSIPHETVRTVFDACYLSEVNGALVESKALLSCEILSGFLSNAIVESNYLDNDYYEGSNVKAEWFNGWYYNNSEDYQYPLFNKLEAQSLEAIIDVINQIDNITFDATTQSSSLNRDMLIAIDNMFDKMKDEENDTQSVIGLALYEKAIYNSLMVSDPGICGLVHNPLVLNMYFGSNETLKTQFEKNYELMLLDNFKDASNESFDFALVKDAVHNMLDALLIAKGL